MIPKNLMLNQKLNPKKNVQTLKNHKKQSVVLNKIIICDETWIFTYETKAIHAMDNTNFLKNEENAK